MLGTEAILVICLCLPGVTLAAMPWLTPRGEAFAVTIPPARSGDERLRRMRAGYAAAMLALTALVVALYVGHVADALVVTALSCVVPVFGFLAMLVLRARVRDIKAAEGWRATAPASSNAVVLPAGAPEPLPLRWNLLYVPVIAATALLVWALWPVTPDRIPMQAGFDGQVHSWADKSVGSVALPVLIQVFLAVVFVGCHYAILRSKRGRAGSRPVASAVAYGRFARVQSEALLGLGLALTASMSFIALADAAVIPTATASVAVMAVTLASAVVVLAVCVRTGQSGARYLGDADAADRIGEDEDSRWKAGVFYVGREDPSLMVPKRFGVGWTLNLGNWRAWAILAALVALTVGFVVVCARLAS